MTNTSLNKMTITEDNLGNCVDTFTNTIVSVITDDVPTKSIKRNSIGSPITIEIEIETRWSQKLVGGGGGGGS